MLVLRLQKNETVLIGKKHIVEVPLIVAVALVDDAPMDVDSD